MYPQLAGDIFEGEEYYGESPLHIAIVFNDFETVKLLVQNGANVNQRATGRFFLPDDQKGVKPKSIADTNYQGYAYYGEYPIAFAACFGLLDIYDYLIGQGADPNLQDSFGNTVAHMLVINDKLEMFTHAVTHTAKKATTTIKNKANLTALTLASKLGRNAIFQQMLELNKMEFWRYSNVQCSAYPLLGLDTIGPNGHTDLQSGLQFIINGDTDDHLQMIEGGVVRRLLDDKWNTFARRRFLQRLVLLSLHLLFMSIAVYTRPGDHLLAGTDAKTIVRFICEIMVIINSVISIIFLQVLEIKVQGMRSFINNLKAAPPKAIFLISNFLFIIAVPFRFLQENHIEENLLIFAVPCSWAFLLFFASAFRIPGPFVIMIGKMLTGDIIRFAIIYITFLLSFSQGFVFLFKDVPEAVAENVTFQSPQGTVMTLFQMSFGEIKYEDFELSRYPVLTKMVFAVYMILVPILLLNMLIAMMGNTYQTVITKGEKEWRRQWAQIVIVLERTFSAKQLLEFQRQYAIKIPPPPSSLQDDSVDAKSVDYFGLMVIKNATKTKAAQRRGAVRNWKRSGRCVVTLLREQGCNAEKLRLHPLNQPLPPEREQITLDDALAQLARSQDTSILATMGKTAGGQSQLSAKSAHRTIAVASPHKQDKGSSEETDPKGKNEGESVRMQALPRRPSPDGGEDTARHSSGPSSKDNKNKNKKRVGSEASLLREDTPP